MRSMVSTANEGTSLAACATGRKRLIQPDQLPPRYNHIYLFDKHAFALALGDKLEAGGGKADLFQ